MRFKCSHLMIVALVTTLPVGSGAQTQPGEPAGAASAASAQQNASSPSKKHLDEAAALLKAVSDATLKGDAKEKLAELRSHFETLVTVYNTNPDGFESPVLAGPSDADDDESEVVTWKTVFAEVENDLADFIGIQQAPAAGPTGIKNLDPAVRKQLEQFRLQVELFLAAATMNLEGETAR